jgi:hypothetical protein
MANDPRAIVFLGPSVPKAHVPSLGFDVRPPAQQGDVLRALAAGAKRIGIIDGYFDQVPSVWHKEIVYALERGVLVYGAASMGALRAAELHSFGMIGIGRVFELYRDGILEDDDEVALLHASAEDGHRPISEAMVNLRDLVDAAVAANVIARAEADVAVAELKALPYPQRSIPRLVELAPALGSFVKQPRIPLKERDALALFERLASGDDRPADETNRTRAERTVFFERLRQEIERARAGPPSDAPERRRRRAALLAILATKHALQAGATPTGEDIEAVLREHMTKNGLATPEALEAFLATSGTDLERFLDDVRAEATVRRLELVYAADIDRAALPRDTEEE